MLAAYTKNIFLLTEQASLPRAGTRQRQFERQQSTDGRRYDIQHNDTQHNDTQHKGLTCDIQHNGTLCRVSRFLYYYAGCRYAECHHTECRYAKCRGAP